MGRIFGGGKTSGPPGKSIGKSLIEKGIILLPFVLFDFDDGGAMQQLGFNFDLRW